MFVPLILLRSEKAFLEMMDVAKIITFDVTFARSPVSIIFQCCDGMFVYEYHPKIDHTKQQVAIFGDTLNLTHKAKEPHISWRTRIRKKVRAYIFAHYSDFKEGHFRYLVPFLEEQ